MAFFTSAINIFTDTRCRNRSRTCSLGELSIFWKVMVMIIRVQSHRESSSLWQVEVSF